MNKIIFLDIDGVLNVIPTKFDDYGACFNSHFENNLSHLIERTQAKIVISSTWRLSGIEAMRDMWKRRGLAGEILSVTPYLEDRIRGNEIEKWLQMYPTAKYVIIDDDTDMLDKQQSYFVRTSENFDHKGNVEGYGLTKECTNKAIEILNN